MTNTGTATRTIQARDLTTDHVLVTAKGVVAAVSSVTPMPNGVSVELGLVNVKARSRKPYFQVMGLYDTVQVTR